MNLLSFVCPFTQIRTHDEVLDHNLSNGQCHQSFGAFMLSETFGVKVELKIYVRTNMKYWKLKSTTLRHRRRSEWANKLCISNPQIRNPNPQFLLNCTGFVVGWWIQSKRWGLIRPTMAPSRSRTKPSAQLDRLKFEWRLMSK